MKVMFHPRSILMGAVLSVLILLALGASLKDSPQAGRFQIETTENNVFVLDTATGRVWGKYVSPRQDPKGEEFMGSRLSCHPSEIPSSRRGRTNPSFPP